MKNRVSENMQWPTDKHLKCDYIGLFRFAFLSFLFISAQRMCYIQSISVVVRMTPFPILDRPSIQVEKVNSIHSVGSVAVFIVATEKQKETKPTKKKENVNEKRIYVIRKP